MFRKESQSEGECGNEMKKKKKRTNGGTLGSHES